MARPIRDFATPTASAGDPVRAITRFSDGYEWISHGDDALVKAGGSIADLIQNRVQKASELEDATARAEGLNRARMTLAERLRGLDPRAEDYQSRVEAAIAEASTVALERTSFRQDDSRTRFSIDLQGIAVEARLKAAEVRERAVIDSARVAVEQATNAAVAQIATQPGSRALALAQWDAQVGPILARVRPEVADELRRDALRVTAEEDTRAMLARRDFRGVETALRTYGGEGLLTPTSVRQIRAGLESERRQAAAEARTRSREAVIDVGLAIQEGQLAGDLRGAREALDRAAQAGLIPAGSPEHRRLGINLARAEAQIRDRGGEDIAAAQVSLMTGRALTPEGQSRYLAAEARRAADAAVAALPENATEEQRQQARRDGMARGIDTGIAVMLAANPTVVPDALRDRAADSTDPRLPAETRAQMILSVVRHGVDVPAVQDALEANPAAKRAVTRLQALGLPITEEAVAAELRRLDGIDEGTRRRNREEWRRQTTGRDASVNPGSLLDTAIQAEFPERAHRGAIQGVRQQQALGYMEEAVSWGDTPEQAARDAARWLRNRYPVSLAGTVPVQLPIEQSPLHVLPQDLRRSYGDEALAGALRQKIEPVLETVFGAQARDYDATFYATRVADGSTVIRAAVRNRLDPAGQWRDLTRTQDGDVWAFPVTGSTVEGLEQFLGLRDLRQREINASMGRSVVLDQDIRETEARVTQLRQEADERALRRRREAAARELQRAEEAAQRTGGNWSAARIAAHQQRQRAEAERLRGEIEAIDRALAGGVDIAP